MKIEVLYVYPIKSLRGITLPSATLTERGIPHDRKFMLLKVHRDGPERQAEPRLENMHVSHFPQLCLFTCAFLPAPASPSLADVEAIEVTHTHPASKAQSRVRVLLRPDTRGLERVQVRMHQSATGACAMPAELSAWFSERLGFEVVLAVLGEGDGRSVLGNVAPGATVRNAAWQERRRRETQAAGGWSGGLLEILSGKALGWLGGGEKSEENGGAKEEDGGYRVTFADCAPYLIASTASLEDFSMRFNQGEGMDLTKCRPNLVVSGVGEAWEEDFWSEVVITRSSKATAGHRRAESNGWARGSSTEGEAGSETVLQLTANCVRCPSLNVDYDTGDFGTGDQGEALKKLQSDRRVDGGQKYSPVFGRYGFLSGGDQCDGHRRDIEARVVGVGDDVSVSRRNEERTVFRWPGMGGWPKEDIFPVA